jgi:uncharacterized membrane protein
MTIAMESNTSTTITKGALHCIIVIIIAPLYVIMSLIDIHIVLFTFSFSAFTLFTSPFKYSNHYNRVNNLQQA